MHDDHARAVEPLDDGRCNVLAPEGEFALKVGNKVCFRLQAQELLRAAY
jgi:hypothetical protein